MKFFKTVRVWLATALCACMCITGGLAINSLTKKEAQATDNTTVEISSDIQMLVDSFNAKLNGQNNYTTAEYKYDFTMSNGSKASGILLTIDTSASTGTGQYFPNVKKLDNITFDVSNFNGNTPMFSYIIAPVTGDKYYTTANRYVPDPSKPGSFLGPEFLIGITNIDNYNGWFIRNYDDTDATSYENTKGVPTGGIRLNTYNAAGNGRDDRGGYMDNPKYLVGTRGYGATSIQGNQKTPFSVYYDYATNVVYKDKHPSYNHGGANHRLLGFPNVQPADFGDLASTFDNKYCGRDSLKLKAYTGTAVTYSHNVAGYTDGKANVAIRIGTIRGTKFSVLLTNVMGLDLTDPTSTFAEGTVVLSSENEGFVVGEESKIPTPAYKTIIGDVTDKVFEGTVDIYKGERSYKYAYGSCGSTMASLADDTALTLLAEDVAVGSNYTFTGTGAYTFVYTDTEGNVTYSTAVVTEGISITLDSVNTTVYRD